MHSDHWLTAEQAEAERRYMAWCRRLALPLAAALGFALLALFLWALWSVSALLFT